MQDGELVKGGVYRPGGGSEPTTSVGIGILEF